jgi:hypothetical protein
MTFFVRRLPYRSSVEEGKRAAKRRHHHRGKESKENERKLRKGR